MESFKDGVNTALSNPLEALARVKVESDLAKESPEFKVGKYFIVGFILGFPLGLLAALALKYI